ncbi:MAG: phosphoribosyl-AMP cyclohydrolase [Euryarchaeota archaeon]|nr:phosphoribosyl-AMP cyclohydrolase [Euryarchaeota archaeon]
MVSEADINIAQKAWGDGIVAIASAHLAGGDYVGIARNHVETLYAYGISTVLFKPTLASVEQFRPNFESALSYFVASNNACPEDKGFAIKGWTNVRFENSDIILRDDSAVAMGNYFFTTPEGDEVKVEYTFGYIVDSSGNLRINLHHSSMPATN